MEKNNFNDGVSCYNNNCDDKKCCCKRGPRGPRGPQGIPGPQGEPGPAGSVLNYADFYAVMPPDNATAVAPEAAVAPGIDVSFPQDGPNSGSGITRISPSSFKLKECGVYQILFQATINESGQLVLTLNDDELEYTLVGRATGTSQIIGMAIVVTTEEDSVLTVRNPAGNSTALVLTPYAGGIKEVTAHLVITQIK